MYHWKEKLGFNDFFRILFIHFSFIERDVNKNFMDKYFLGVCLWNKDNNGTKTNLYDPYAMGYRRAAQTTTIWYEIARFNKSPTVVQYEL